MRSRASKGIAIAALALAASVADLSAQKPVVTLTASTTRIAERLTLNGTSTRTLSTTTTTTSRLSASTAASTAPTSNAVTFTVSRTGPTTLTDLTVRYSVSGTALSAKDYSPCLAWTSRPGRTRRPSPSRRRT